MAKSRKFSEEQRRYINSATPEELVRWAKSLNTAGRSSDSIEARIESVPAAAEFVSRYVQAIVEADGGWKVPSPYPSVVATRLADDYGVKASVTSVRKLLKEGVEALTN